MADNVQTQSGTLATVPTATTFRTYTDVSGVEYFPALFLTSSTGPPWTFQGVDNTASGHGLPIQALAGAVAQLPAVLTGSGNLKVSVAESTASSSVTVTSEVSSAFATAPAQVAVGTSAVQLDAGGHACAFGVAVKALNANTGTVYVGSSTGVTAGDGFELGPGESISLPVSNTNLVWAIASASSQKVSLLGV